MALRLGPIGHEGGSAAYRVSVHLFPADFLVDIDIHRTAKQRPPALEIGLYPWIAGNSMAVKLDRLVRLVLDLLHEAGRIVHVLQQANARAAEGLDEGPGRVHHRQELRAVGAWQGEFELQCSPDCRKPVWHRVGLSRKRRRESAPTPMLRAYDEIPKRASAAESVADGGRPDVNTICAGGASEPAGGPIRSTTRRAIAGAGSMKVTGQGARCSRRGRSRG